jgi:phosphatidylglycerophosphate synthase
MQARILSLGSRVSLVRILLALIFLCTFRSTPGYLLNASLLTAIVAQITDHLDGYLVRRFDSPSLIGWICDSVSDRAFYIAALLAFQREYAFTDLLTWLFALREIMLYAIRVISGDFEAVLRGFRKLTLAHAAFVRIGILMGCLFPYGLLESEFNNWILFGAQAMFWLATSLGFYNLYVLLKRMS